MTPVAPLLTLAVPTYNRLHCLRLLLEAILPEVRELRARGTDVDLLVSDNASSDGTAEYLVALAQRGDVRLLRNATNIGADANVLRCFHEARGRHLWILGDDDLPLPGVVLRVARFLAESEPDLLYLPARWHACDLSLLRRAPPSPHPPCELAPMQLAVRANAYVTFLSSWVVHRDRYLALADARPARFGGTSLPQLEWHLALLAAGRRLHAAPQAWLLARAGHSGGYSLFDTFVDRYHAILRERLQGERQECTFLQEHLLRGYLPGLVWGLRVGTAGGFQPGDWERVEALMARTWPGQERRRAWVSRIAQWPKPAAWVAMALCWFDAQAWMAGARQRADRAAR